MKFLSVVVSAVVVVTSPGQSIIFTPTVSLVMWVSDFCGLVSQIILQCITFRSCDICGFGMKNIVFDPETMLPKPCASLLNSLKNYL